MYKNRESYPDPTPGKEIRRADREFDRETEEYKNTKKKENEE